MNEKVTRKWISDPHPSHAVPLARAASLVAYTYRLSSLILCVACQGKCCYPQLDRGKPAVRDEMGGVGN